MNNKISVVIGTVDLDLDNVQNNTPITIAYNRINDIKDINEFTNIIKGITKDKLLKVITDFDGREMKHWYNNDIEYYNKTIFSTKGKPSKLRHCQNPDGSYYKTETISIKDLIDKTNVNYAIFLDSNNIIYIRNL